MEVHSKTYVFSPSHHLWTQHTLTTPRASSHIFHSHSSDPEFKELLHFLVIEMIREVLLLEVLLELLPSDPTFINMFHLLQLVPPHYSFSVSMVGGNPIFQIWWIVMQLEISLESKLPCFDIIFPFSFTIKGRWLELPQLSLQTIYLLLPSLVSDRRHLWTSYGIFRCIKLSFWVGRWLVSMRSTSTSGITISSTIIPSFI